jgi:hypothetical protein
VSSAHGSRRGHWCDLQLGGSDGHFCGNGGQCDVVQDRLIIRRVEGAAVIGGGPLYCTCKYGIAREQHRRMESCRALSPQDGRPGDILSDELAA